jgi:hypothetical protein
LDVACVCSIFSQHSCLPSSQFHLQITTNFPNSNLNFQFVASILRLCMISRTPYVDDLTCGKLISLTRSRTKKKETSKTCLFCCLKLSLGAISSISSLYRIHQQCGSLSSDCARWLIRNNFLINLSLITRTVSKWHREIFRNRKKSFNHISG